MPRGDPNPLGMVGMDDNKIPSIGELIIYTFHQNRKLGKSIDFSASAIFFEEICELCDRSQVLLMAVNPGQG